MSIWIDGIEIIINDKFIKFAAVAPECYGMVSSYEELSREMSKRGYFADIFTFGQRLPEIEPKHNHFMEWQAIAALKISTYDNWLSKQIIKENRKNIGKAAKKGVKVAQVEFNDDLVKGIMDIYNEAPIRQGRKFWHFNKDFQTVKMENGTYADRSIFIGAYFENSLIGFVKIVLTEGCASTLQVISKIEHRDKKPTNALMAKTVEICASMGIPYLQYGVWSHGTLGDFKRYNGFEKMLLPKYFIPITLKGKAILMMRLHQGIKNHIPDGIFSRMKEIRKKWYERKILKYKFGRP
jgi:hypothetical protein